MARFGDLIEKDRKIYGNCQVISPEGILMFRCDEKKLNWYLSRDLAEIVDDDPKTIQLKFQPNGFGNHDKEYGLTIMENKCVSCGTEEFLTRHHVVPYCYRKFFPTELKSHNFHDVLSLCVDCHEDYEYFAFKEKERLAGVYDAPINGETSTDRDLMRVKRMSYGILDNPNIPKKRLKEMKGIIREHFGLKRLRDSRIRKIAEMEIPSQTITHGQIVVSKLDDIQSFIQMWRQHFVNHSDCRFLPENWNIKNNLSIDERSKRID